MTQNKEYATIVPAALAFTQQFTTSLLKLYNFSAFQFILISVFKRNF
uniref:Uncharacterized protein n=1 Tax=Rhizophora mucronata TaxID=61149 RepID=A0A2P2IXZ3_RHIMU